MTRLARFSLPPWVPALALLAGLAGTADAKRYDIAYDGNRLDLSGYIDASSLGSFSPTAFNAVAVDYSITVTIDNTWSFVFNTGDSTWGNNAFGSWGSAITIVVTDGAIHVDSALTDDFNAATLFLMTDAIHNGALENLRVSGNRLGLRPPIPSTGESVVFDSARPIPFATAPIPEPSTYALMAAGLAAVAGLARRRKAQA